MECVKGRGGLEEKRTGSECFKSSGVNTCDKPLDEYFAWHPKSIPFATDKSFLSLFFHFFCPFSLATTADTSRC